MKIGILTYHRSHNYGALLQGIALKEVLVRLGHQVTFIDYWPAYHRHIYALFSFHWMMARKGIRAKISYLKNCIANYKNRKNRKTNFDAFIKSKKAIEARVLAFLMCIGLSYIVTNFITDFLSVSAIIKG